MKTGHSNRDDNVDDNKIRNRNDSGGPDGTREKALGWPVGIFIAYLIFVGCTLGFVFFTFTVPVNLEKADYYESTLRWQDQIERVSRTAAMEEQVRFEIAPGAEHILVHFPENHVNGGISGRILMFRPSDYLMDREFGISTDSLGWQSIPVAGMQRGHWIMKVSWEAAGGEFYWQNNIHL